MKADPESSFAHVVQAMKRQLQAEDALFRARAESEKDVREMLVAKAEKRLVVTSATLDATADEFVEQVRGLIKQQIMAAVAAMPTQETAA